MWSAFHEYIRKVSLRVIISLATISIDLVILIEEDKHINTLKI